MRKGRRICMVIAIVVVMAIIISGITVAAVSFGIKAAEKQSALSTADNESDEISETAVDDISDEDVADASEKSDIDDEEYKKYFENAEDIPAAICRFAYKNDLPLENWPQELIDMLNQYPETVEFVLNYPYFKDQTFKIDNSYTDYVNSVPLFLQWDKRWGYTPYGDDMIANAGCGPTCLSMVATHLLKDPSLNPKAIARFSEDYGYCEPGFGSKWSLIYEGGELLGLDVYEVDCDEDVIVNNLEAGNPIICLVGPGDFTYGGHFIVLTDYVNGQIKINDPNSVINSKKLWNFEDIKDQIEIPWVCTVS
ncbi:MAG: C39 family peptidase [Clostridia bacterium]|nr:C39 family peptidase [Clostridia bacterium]